MQGFLGKKHLLNGGILLKLRDFVSWDKKLSLFLRARESDFYERMDWQCLMSLFNHVS